MLARYGNKEMMGRLQVQQPTVLMRPLENDISPFASFKAFVKAVTRHR